MTEPQEREEEKKPRAMHKNDAVGRLLQLSFSLVAEDDEVASLQELATQHQATADNHYREAQRHSIEATAHLTAAERHEERSREIMTGLDELRAVFGDETVNLAIENARGLHMRRRHHG